MTNTCACRRLACARGGGLPFSTELPAWRGILGGRLGRRRRDVLCPHPVASRRGGVCRSTLPPTPLQPCAHASPPLTSALTRPRIRPLRASARARLRRGGRAGGRGAAGGGVARRGADRAGVVEFSCVGAAGQLWQGHRLVLGNVIEVCA
jgi:hypothetical protein